MLGAGHGVLWAVAGGAPGEAQDLVLALALRLRHARVRVGPEGAALSARQARRLAVPAGSAPLVRASAWGPAGPVLLAAGSLGPPTGPADRRAAALFLRLMAQAPGRIWLLSDRPPETDGAAVTELARWAAAADGCAVCLSDRPAGRRRLRAEAARLLPGRPAFGLDRRLGIGTVAVAWHLAAAWRVGGGRAAERGPRP
jgi:hypothetical protein